MPKNAKHALRAANPDSLAGDADEEDDEEIVERLTSQEAYLFPLLGSVTLVGRYQDIPLQ